MAIARGNVFLRLSGSQRVVQVARAQRASDSVALGQPATQIEKAAAVATEGKRGASLLSGLAADRTGVAIARQDSRGSSKGRETHLPEEELLPFAPPLLALELEPLEELEAATEPLLELPSALAFAW